MISDTCDSSLGEDTLLQVPVTENQNWLGPTVNMLIQTEQHNIEEIPETIQVNSVHEMTQPTLFTTIGYWETFQLNIILLEKLKWRKRRKKKQI